MMHLERGMFSGRRVATHADLRRLLDHLVAELADRLADHVRIEVVATVDALPDEAPPTRMYRVAADPNGLYVGNGQGRPLSRATLAPLS